MRPALILTALLSLSQPLGAQNVAVMVEAEAAEPVEAALPGEPVVITTETLSDFTWINRVIVVFADTPRDPAFVQQMDLLREQPHLLAERDIVVLVDTDPAAMSAMRTELRPRGFALVVVDKDGRLMQRKPAPWDLREITRAIDKTPLRQQELREMKPAP